MWNGFRELILTDKIEECPGIVSFYFKAKDGGKLAAHKPGQFLPFKIKTEDIKYKDLIRTYSLSMAPNEYVYRISVKKIDNGLISSYLHDNLNIGDSIDAMVPTGIFISKNKPANEPIVLLSGGIGITPLLSMLYKESKTKNNIHFIQAVQNSEIQPFRKDIETLAKMNDIRSTVFYSNPLDTDVKGKDFDELGYVTKEWLSKNVPLNGEFYFCGPPIFMKGIESSLLELGVDKERINFEMFS